MEATEKKTINVIDLKPQYMPFGNKGACWSDEVHIYGFGDRESGNLCGNPALSSNWARIWEHPTVGCQKCIEIYENENK